MRFSAATLAIALAMPALTGCGRSAALRGQIAGLDAITQQASKAGAKKCAPRELALAESNLRFAEVELAQGSVWRAEHHLAIAEPNAHAALAMSPADRCAEDAVDGKDGDRDGDGIADAFDQCPDKRESYNGFEDLDGCPDDADSDADGVPDSRDACRMLPEDRDGYLDDDGCPDPDNDLDGIPDEKDKCPMQAEDPDGFQDDDGCPDPDNDGDTVPDVEDACPTIPGQPGGDRSGCPKLVMVTAGEIRITQQIQFETGSAKIRPVSFPILDAVKDVLVQNPQIKLEVQGHTDNQGQAAYNLKLSQQRADSVRSYLSSHGIEGERLTAKGFGMDKPIVPNTTNANKAQNRRVQFIRVENAAAK
jgi:OOP family OmpA-OmpF porin